MTTRTASRLAWGVSFLCLAMLSASLVLLYLNRTAIDSASTADVSDLIATLTLGLLGGLVASRRPANPIGWILLTIAVAVGLSALSTHVAMRALLAGVPPQRSADPRDYGPFFGLALHFLEANFDRLDTRMRAHAADGVRSSVGVGR